MTGAPFRASNLARQLVYRSDLVNGLLRMVNRQGRILMFHSIGRPDLDEDVFRAQLQFLTRHFEICPLNEIWTSGSVARPRVALTFDDGLRNNFTLAYPLLREFGARATFFVCPGLMEAGTWLWNHECRARLAWMSPQARRDFARDLGSDGDSIEPLIAALKNMPHGARRQMEHRLREMSPGFCPTAEQRDRFDLMSWSELKQLDPALITIGAHSTHHEILTRLEPQHLEREVIECGEWLERELRRPIRHFCYPDGAYNPEVRHCVSTRFESAVTVKEGLVPPTPDLLELPRIPVAQTARDMAWRMHRPHS